MSQDEWNQAYQVFKSFASKNLGDYNDIYLEQTLCH